MSLSTANGQLQEELLNMSGMDKIAVSKFLSLVLRHRPEVIGVSLDAEGWLDIGALIESANRHGTKLSLELVHAAVAENDKQRFALSEDGLRIRANQGHSIRSVQLPLTAVPPPEQLYHGTVPQFLASIRTHGLLKRWRNHVHLSADAETAQRVGMRRGTPVVLLIDATTMHREAFRFYLSDNGVWLTDEVPVKYLRFPEV